MHPDWVATAVKLATPIQRHWFRVRSHGAEHIPARGRAILAANHGGPLPIDGAMIYLDVVEHTEPARVPRPIGDHFISSLPFVSSLYARVGVVNGTRGNVERLLEAEELLLFFPEGAAAIAKPRARHYRIGAWHVGHAELAILHHAPVIPVAVIGAEEQWPLLARIDWLRPFGAPFLPIPATPFPLPVPIDIHYGEPLDLAGDGADPECPGSVARAAERVRSEVQRLVDEGLRARERRRS